MRILHIEDCFYPEAGYQINIIPKYLNSFGHENIILSCDLKKVPDSHNSSFNKRNYKEADCAYSERTGVKIVRIPSRHFFSGRVIFKTKTLIKTIQLINPDIVYVHGNDTFTGIQVLRKRKRINKPIICDSHMLKMASNNKLSYLFHVFYKLFITPIIKKEQITVIRTQNDDFVKSELGIPLNLCPWISYGSDVSVFHPDSKIREKFRKDNLIDEDCFLVTYAGKLDEAKGGLFLAEAIKKRFNNGKICFMIIGNTYGEYGAEVDDCLNKSENRVIRFPIQKYLDLAQFYQSSDLVVFPKQCSLSFYDVQACGVPVLSCNNKINQERCSHSNGWVFTEDSINDFRDKISFVSSLDENKIGAIKKNSLNFILSEYNYEQKSREYEKEILNSYNRKKKTV